MNLFKLVGSIFIDTEKANDSLSKTDEKAENLGNKFVSVVGKTVKAGASIATAVGGMAVATGAALVKVAEGTREYREEMGKLETAFESAGHSNEAATNTYKNLQAVLGDTGQAVEAANHLELLCENEKDLQEWTDICTGVYGTFGDSLPIEGLTEAANETVKTGQVTGALADALNWAGVSEDEFNQKLAECTTEQERQALVRDTLNGLYSEASAQYKENNKDVIDANAAQERLNDTMAKMGAVVEPIITKGKIGLAQLVEALIPVAETVAEIVIPAIMNFAEWAMPIVVNTINGVIPILTNLMNFVRNVFTGNLTGAFKNLVNLLGGIWKGLTPLVKTPINAVIGLINKFINGLNKLKIPSWVPGVGGKGINISKIPYLAKGGNILEAGHAIVGEAGPELIDLPAGATVRPLTNGNSDFMNSKMNEQLDRLVFMLSEFMPQVLTGMQRNVVLSTGETVGAFLPYIDRGLSDENDLRGRGGV